MNFDKKFLFENFKTVPWEDLSKDTSNGGLHHCFLKEYNLYVKTYLPNFSNYYSYFLLEADLSDEGNQFSEFPDNIFLVPENASVVARRKWEGEQFDCNFFFLSYFPSKGGRPHKLFALLLYPVFFYTKELYNYRLTCLNRGGAASQERLRFHFYTCTSFKEISSRTDLVEVIDFMTEGFEKVLYDRDGHRIFQRTPGLSYVNWVNKAPNFLFITSLVDCGDNNPKAYRQFRSRVIIPFGDLLFPFPTTSQSGLEQLINAYSLYCSLSGLYLAEDGWLYRKEAGDTGKYNQVLLLTDLSARFPSIVILLEEFIYDLYRVALLPPLLSLHVQHSNVLLAYLKVHLPVLIFSNYLVQKKSGLIINLLTAVLSFNYKREAELCYTPSLDPSSFKGIPRHYNWLYTFTAQEFESDVEIPNDLVHPRRGMAVKYFLNDDIEPNEIGRIMKSFYHGPLNSIIYAKSLANFSNIFGLLSRYEELVTYLECDGRDTLEKRISYINQENRVPSDQDITNYIAFYFAYKKWWGHTLDNKPSSSEDHMGSRRMDLLYPDTHFLWGGSLMSNEDHQQVTPLALSIYFNNFTHRVAWAYYRRKD